METGHWIFDQEFDINDWFGFIYRIVELNTGREYVGKKQFFQHLRKTVKGRVNKKRVKKESDWKKYTGSSEHLNKSISEYGLSNYKFIIESLHKTKGSLHYAEVRLQVNEDVLRARLPCGIIPKYYNRQIAGVKFIPPAEHTEESKMKMSSTLIEKYKIDPHWRSTLTEAEIHLLNDKFYSGNNHYLYRLMTPEERTRWIDENVRGENNAMYGETPHNKGMSMIELYGEERASIIKEAIKNSMPDMSGKNNPFFNKTHNDDQKEKWKYDQRRVKKGVDNGMSGKSVTDFMTEEEIKTWKENISKSTKGIPKEKVTCPHCEKLGAAHVMNRWHFDNCKNKK